VAPKTWAASAHEGVRQHNRDRSNVLIFLKTSHCYGGAIGNIFLFLVDLLPVNRTNILFRRLRNREELAMSTQPVAAAPRRPRLSLSLDTWAVIAAVVLVLAIVVGTLPRVPW
jgi:hypothetical protein